MDTPYYIDSCYLPYVFCTFFVVFYSNLKDHTTVFQQQHMKVGRRTWKKTTGEIQQLYTIYNFTLHSCFKIMFIPAYSSVTTRFERRFIHRYIVHKPRFNNYVTSVGPILERYPCQSSAYIGFAYHIAKLSETLVRFILHK